MKKKPAQKKTVHHVKNKQDSEKTVFWYTVIVFSLVLMVFANVGYKLSKPHVLGASTTLLAEGGDQGDTNTGNNQPDSNAGSSAAQDTHATTTNTSPSSSSVSDSTKVDCVGPDGNHFTTEFHNCQELNAKWGKSNFSFTPLATPKDQPEGSSSQGNSDTQSPDNKSHQTLETPQGKLEVQVDGTKKEVNLESKGVHVEMKTEDNGVVKIHATTPDGKEVQLNTQDALNKLNDALKSEDVQVGSSEGGLAIKKGDVEAKTSLPISVDPTTHELTVTTPAGTKTVAVLPDRAVQNLLATGVLSGVTSQASTVNTNSPLQQVQLTTVNGEPAFQVQGVLSKKLFGLFPVAFSKTAFVSAEDGHTISIDQSFLTSLLQTLSF